MERVCGPARGASDSLTAAVNGLARRISALDARPDNITL
jgi:hypothetical protein